MKSLFVHCGLHKTGTTALQDFLASHRADLLQRGYFYPHAGIPPYMNAQHNIAWEITGDSRFIESNGTLAMLFDEIASFDGDVILSSEDFEGALLHPDSLRPLVTMAARQERKVEFVIYFRDQASYMESLYLEMLKYGYCDDYLNFAEKIISAGTLRIGDWEFCFDYGEIVRSLANMDETGSRYRSYHSLLDGSIIADFLVTVGIDPAQFRKTALLRNARGSSIVAMQLFYQNRLGRQLSIGEKAAVRTLCTTDSHLATPASYRRNIADRFRESNSTIAALVRDAEAPTYNGKDSGYRSEIDISRFFSSESVRTLDVLAKFGVALRVMPPAIWLRLHHGARHWHQWVREQ